jgi:hypothetical protein
MIKLILIALLALNSVDIGTTITVSHNISVTTTPAHVKKTGMAKAIIKPAENYKWNKDFPTSFEFMHYESAVADPLKKKASFKEGKLCVPYIGKLKGRTPIVLAISYSICNKEECLTFRGQKVVLSLIVD